MYILLKTVKHYMHFYRASNNCGKCKVCEMNLNLLKTTLPIIHKKNIYR